MIYKSIAFIILCTLVLSCAGLSLGMLNNHTGQHDTAHTVTHAKQSAQHTQLPQANHHVEHHKIKSIVEQQSLGIFAVLFIIVCWYRESERNRIQLLQSRHAKYVKKNM